MKQVTNTECGPVILCDGCYDSLNSHSIEIGEGRIIAEDVSGIVPDNQQCDICGDKPMKVR